ncbi:MAG: 4'-phosphopantetheinyl transferase superfamily protein [Ruminiclostridium sp.]|nr:4'-phosphopantetheinyl transferase superfamily protein [Ruminiclostridium sp.]
MITFYFLQEYGSSDLLLPALSPSRRLLGAQAGSEAVRRERIFSYVLLRLALLEEFGISDPPEFMFGEYGKPFLRDNPDVFFSLSHSSGAALCAVASFPIGADLQECRKMRPGIENRFCTPREIARIRDSSARDRELSRLWCIKESRGKLTGKGFSERFDTIESEALLQSGRAQCLERGDFFLSICADRELESPELRTVTEAELLERFGRE